MGIIYSASPIFIILFSFFLFNERINKYGVTATIICLTGVIVVLSKGKLINLVSLKFTPGDLWIAGAMISWAIYSIYLMNFKSNFDLVTRFALMIFLEFYASYLFILLRITIFLQQILILIF